MKAKRFSLADARKRAAQVHRNRANARKGSRSECGVIDLMRSMGFLCVRKIHNEIIPIRRAGKIVSAKFGEQVVGDIAAIMPGGRSVLVEAKDRKEFLKYGDLEEHQHAALTEHHRNGGLSLIAWKSSKGLALMLYSDCCLSLDPPMRHGRWLRWDEAHELHMRGRIDGSVD